MFESNTFAPLKGLCYIITYYNIQSESKDLATTQHRLDSGVFKAIQRAGVEAFSGPQDNIQKMNEIYTGRRNVVVNGLNKLGWNLKPIKATFYIWIPTLNKMKSVDFANLLLEKRG